MELLAPIKALKRIPEILEIHAITGQYTIFVKIKMEKKKEEHMNFLDILLKNFVNI